MKVKGQILTTVLSDIMAINTPFPDSMYACILLINETQILLCIKRGRKCGYNRKHFLEYL